MTEASEKDLLLDAFREIHSFYNQWLLALASGFDDKTGLEKPKESVNHALWLLGHMTWLQDALLVEVPTGKSFRNKEWDVLFKIGSERFPDERYPSYSEVLDHCRKVGEEIAGYLRDFPEDDLGKPCHQMTDWFKTPVSAMLSFLRDGNYHLGQMSYLAKLLEIKFPDKA
jgi:hypothetical protein